MSGWATVSTQMQIAEIQGLYGPVTLSERLIQRIWLRRDFRQDHLRTASGKALRVFHPGRWNLQEGPDFLGADLELDGQRRRGDVEIHFYEQDWRGHGHHAQKRFDEVILHVVVFPPKPDTVTTTPSGKHPETLCLLPHLQEDLEAYAAEEAMRGWEGDTASLLEGFLCQAPQVRAEQLVENARKRFLQKVGFARHRLEADSWQQTLHAMTLEVLGYRRNRAPMSAIAQAHPPQALPRHDADDLFQSQAGHWKLAGLRPANHPRQRLDQYLQLLQKAPNWQARLTAWGKSQRVREGTFSTDTRLYRKVRRLTAQRREIAEDILAASIGGTRLDTWMADAALPLLAVREPAAWFPLWFHWFPGDMPEAVTTILSQAELPPVKQPRGNGWAQGAWQLFLESGL